MNSSPTGEPVDLMDGYARRLRLSSAAMVMVSPWVLPKGLAKWTTGTSQAAEPTTPRRLGAKAATLNFGSRFNSGP